jgi:hypothetical protein
MSITGKATANNLLRGTINKLDIIHVNTYEIAVKNGFVGTVEEWLSLLQMGGGTGTARLSEITIYASAWTGEDSLYSQVVALSGITKYSKIDLLPSVEQLAIFHNKDVTFVTENEDGVVTVYAIGDKPTQDYTMQVSITEVAV